MEPLHLFFLIYRLFGKKNHFFNDEVDDDVGMEGLDRVGLIACLTAASKTLSKFVDLSAEHSMYSLA